MQIALIIPCHNVKQVEFEFITSRIIEFNRSLKTLDAVLNVIIVDDCNNDALSNIHVADTNLIILKNDSNLGKGGSIKKAIERFQNFNSYLFTDSDFPYTNNNMLDVVNPILNGLKDLSLVKRNESYYEKISMQRKLFSKMLIFLNSRIFNLKNPDTQGGLKAFNHKAAKLILQCQCNDFLLDLEWILKAEKNKLEIVSTSGKLSEKYQSNKLKTSTVLTEIYNFIKILITKNELSN